MEHKSSDKLALLHPCNDPLADEYNNTGILWTDLRRKPREMRSRWVCGGFGNTVNDMKGEQAEPNLSVNWRGDCFLEAWLRQTFQPVFLLSRAQRPGDVDPHGAFLLFYSWTPDG